MSVKIIVGGQFGSEGKGKVTAHLSKKYPIDAVVRCGGPNSGHTVTFNGKQEILRQIPAGVVNKEIELFISAGCLIDLDVLLDEIVKFDVSDRIFIDRNAAIIESGYNNEETNRELGERIGSTCSGTGYAVSKRVLRESRLAKEIPELDEYICNVSEKLNHYCKENKEIVIEGTQGFGLSLYHSDFYPFTTSRDTTASAFLSEVGISPFYVDDIIMVTRTFPIRVSGNSGPLPKEIDWKTIQTESNYPHEIKEFTSVTKKIRRVARFDFEILQKAIMVNNPTRLALMGVDYLNYDNYGLECYDDLNVDAKSYIKNIKNSFNLNVEFIGTGPSDEELIDESVMRGVERHY